MRLSSLPLQNLMRIPKGIMDKKTSELIDLGFIVDYKNPGLPYYPPIGDIILSNVRNMVMRKHSEVGALKIKMPSFMRRDLLNQGEKIEETFKKKFVMVPEPMEKYMLLTTHEAEILDYLSRDKISHKALPLKLFTNKDILRPIKDPKGILKCREFEVVMMLSLDKDRVSFNESLEAYKHISESIFGDLNIPVRLCLGGENRRGSHLDFDLEYFYEGEEGDNLVLDDSEGRVKALSLSMGYEFMPSVNKVSLISSGNEEIKPVVGTYAIGLERVLYTAFDSSRDNQGFNLPKQIRPFDSSVLLFDVDSQASNSLANKIYQGLNESGSRVLYDDRKRIKRKEKAELSDFLGIPIKIIVSKSGI
ncbi:MAG TPA: hypothetical protein ENH46_05330, partial [Candidatus Pacearchaeota archaeon]|nr:hypothetical protein [Candidatus Pacearchaeota archaeon]